MIMKSTSARSLKEDLANSVTRDNGGFAFPSDMTLRDWYRGKALQGVCANPDLVRALCDQSGNPTFRTQTIADIALLAAKIGDAMIKERDK